MHLLIPVAAYAAGLVVDDQTVCSRPTVIRCHRSRGEEKVARRDGLLLGDRLVYRFGDADSLAGAAGCGELLANGFRGILLAFSNASR